jgi:hypothetical protein
MRMKTAVTLLAAFWFVAFMSLFVAFYVWAGAPRSSLSTTLLDSTSWLVLALTLILMPTALIVILTRRRADV